MCYVYLCVVCIKCSVFYLHFVYVLHCVYFSCVCVGQCTREAGWNGMQSQNRKKKILTLATYQTFKSHVHPRRLQIALIIRLSMKDEESKALCICVTCGSARMHALSHIDKMLGAWKHRVGHFTRIVRLMGSSGLPLTWVWFSELVKIAVGVDFCQHINSLCLWPIYCKWGNQENHLSPMLSSYFDNNLQLNDKL